MDQDQLKNHPPIHDPAPNRDELEVYGRRGLAVGPYRVRVSESIKTLREVVDEQSRFNAEVAERQAKLDADKAAAAELQERFAGIKHEREWSRSLIAKAKQNLAASTARLKVIEGEIEDEWQAGESVQSFAAEIATCKFMIELLPGWIAKYEKDFADRTAALKVFAKEHQIAEPGI